MFTSYVPVGSILTWKGKKDAICKRSVVSGIVNVDSVSDFNVSGFNIIRNDHPVASGFF